MAEPELQIRNVGPIRRAYLRFGDLTLLVGPQASGKSISLQLLKLLVDTGSVQTTLRNYGVDWHRQLPRFLDAYLGEGMHTIWASGSSLRWDGRAVDLTGIAKTRR